MCHCSESVPHQSFFPLKRNWTTTIRAFTLLSPTSAEVIGPSPNTLRTLLTHTGARTHTRAQHWREPVVLCSNRCVHYVRPSCSGNTPSPAGPVLARSTTTHPSVLRFDRRSDFSCTDKTSPSPSTLLHEGAANLFATRWRLLHNSWRRPYRKTVRSPVWDNSN